MDPEEALNTGVVDLIGTATAFGQGAIASAISGNPYYSQDPSAANYSRNNGVLVQSSPLGGSTGLIILLAVAYFIFK